MLDRGHALGFRSHLQECENNQDMLLQYPASHSGASKFLFGCAWGVQLECVHDTQGNRTWSVACDQDAAVLDRPMAWVASWLWQLEPWPWQRP